MKLELTFNLLPVVAVVLSLAAKYLPKFNTWYEKLSSAAKQLVMLGAMFLVAVGGSLLSYFGLVDIYPVDQGLTGFIWMPLVDFVISVLVNAGVYKSTNYL